MGKITGSLSTSRHAAGRGSGWNVCLKMHQLLPPSKFLVHVFAITTLLMLRAFGVSMVSISTPQ